MYQKTVENILNIFQGFRMPEVANDQYNVIGRSVLSEKIGGFVSRNLPIDFVMLGYPMKSTNHIDKTLGVMPDMAEEVSMENFSRFAYLINLEYEPGININIANDGLVFHKLLGAKSESVFNYQDIVMDMAKQSNAPISMYNLTDFFKGSLDSQLGQLTDHFGINDVELQKRILYNPDVNFLYNGMIRFMEEEFAHGNFVSRNQLHKYAKGITRKMMLLNEAYSELVSLNFNSSIRLSMHKSINNGNKYSFQLIPSDKAWTAPWHCALYYEKDGTFGTVHRIDAERAGMELVYQDGRPYYFQA